MGNSRIWRDRKNYVFLLRAFNLYHILLMYRASPVKAPNCRRQQSEPLIQSIRDPGRERKLEERLMYFYGDGIRQEARQEAGNVSLGLKTRE